MEDNQDHLNLLRKIKNKPKSSQRELAEELGFSLGKLNYCVKALKSKGRLLIIHASGKDPANEIIRKIWPKENPFPSLGNSIISYLKKNLDKELLDTLSFGEKRNIKCKLRALPTEISNGIANSLIFSAWNASIYVNQMDDDKVMKVEKTKNYEKIVQKVVAKNKGLYFNNEIFVIEKK